MPETSPGASATRVNSVMHDVEDNLFWELHRKCAPYSLLTPEKFYDLYCAMTYICLRSLPGDVVECGVWKGGAVMLAAEILRYHAREDVDIYLYDTFEGFVERSEVDVTAVGGREIGRARHANFMTEVRANIAKTGYPLSRVHFIAGDVRQTVKRGGHKEIALLRLDTDTYASTLHELVSLYDHVVSGGVLIIDDYGYSRGCRAATDEFFADRPKLLFNRPNSGARSAIKL